MPIIPNESATKNTHPFVFYCDKHKWCFYRVALKTDPGKWVTKETAHLCPRPLDKRVGRDIVANIIKSLWEDLDARYLEYTKSAPELREAKGQVMRGMAIVLVELMKPYFETADQIVKEVMARHRSAELGQEHSTPGIGLHIDPKLFHWNPPINDEVQGGSIQLPCGHYLSPVYTKHSRQLNTRVYHCISCGAEFPLNAIGAPVGSDGGVPPKPKSKFSDDEQAAIKAASAAGFDIDMLTVAYACSADDIKAVLDG